ncbi:MAG: hypothetical protein HN793_08615 [Rhodospirillaceae bacterium]|jgi:hypothetical protein|nr:hypothetical protein [Rhodospirillaceae bacterium]MBT5242532.1 hypothetical protein [Rhodospirillaceae bacterium]MBT5565562.1 hypothetical protein [Rhodospirillaceae bacterium]MBT6088331.1 hypothetical protein [Rhodospirillaceae bacterium]MBT7450879.1 hypothetical protein [Rhodospirillaceae bacterium]
MSDLGFRHVRTEEVEWVDDPDIPGFKQKILSRDEETGAVTRLWFVPPNWGEDVFDGKPDRHYHKSVVERGFQLYGDFPHWEFNSVEDFDGDLYIFKRGLFMDRPPGSLHGLRPEPRSQAGAVILYWNTGRGASIKEEAFAEETVNVAFDKDVKVEINAFPACNLTQTETVDWQVHPDVPGWKIKPLAEEGYGADTVDLVFIPSDWRPGDGLRSDDGATQPKAKRRWLYVVTGDLAVCLEGENLKLRQDDYLGWTSPANLSFADGSVSDTGCIAICSGNRLSDAIS